ncbi:MAG: hypothetical protein JOZ46_07810 [Candidatus Dormibacteraeota bacterium]|nr:hypothetical protein [Candidatus Dormibacteraeota bacterium]MBV9525702.1 hypothetical protein [Candidatus Dormibacteraeota bacterium]
MSDPPAAAGKLQLQSGQTVALLNCPRALERTLLNDVDGLRRMDRDPASADAVIAFVIRSDELSTVARPAIDAGRRDALAWLAYPKGGRLGTDLNRDSLRAALEADGVQPVRQVALDDVWSALRLRPR